MTFVNGGPEFSPAKAPNTIAVVIPVYNGENFIRRALDSVLGQTHRAAEIIVVNDGSTDRTPEIVSEYGPAVTLLQQKNGGPSKARNAGVDASTAQFVAFLDADDWWEPTKLEKQLKSFEADPTAVLNYTALRVVDAATGKHTDLSPPALDILERQLRWMNRDMPPSCVMVRRAALKQIGGFNERLLAGEDWYVWFSLRTAGSFCVCPEPLTDYRQSNVGQSGNATFVFNEFLKMLDDVLLKDLSGIKRTIWRRKIMSFQAFMAVKTARGSGNRAEELRFVKMSLRTWPSPFWAPSRFKTFAVTLLRSAQSNRG
ncbi:MAG: glycosyltransferase family 2 protein [Acidobacteria bacterium]|nr:glycosyltransferase family 2 protein [Acidobacteriota bacterium]